MDQGAAVNLRVRLDVLVADLHLEQRMLAEVVGEGQSGCWGRATSDRRAQDAAYGVGHAPRSTSHGTTQGALNTASCKAALLFSPSYTTRNRCQIKETAGGHGGCVDLLLPGCERPAPEPTSTQARLPLARLPSPSQLGQRRTLM